MIIVAIVVSSVILFRVTVKPRNPYVALTDRLSTRGLLYALEIVGGRCASTESGGGLSAVRLCGRINRSIKKIAKRTHDENSVYADIAKNAKRISSSAERVRRACRKSYMLGHVDGVPRIFLFCRTLTEGTRGDVGIKLLSAAVDAFTKNAPLSYAELVALPDMLRTALIGLLAQCIDNVDFYSELYESGKRDGVQGKIDLDEITYDDYVCGLFDCADEKDAAAFDDLLTRNGISRSDAEKRRDETLSDMRTTVHFILGSLSAADKIDDGMLVSMSPVNAILKDSDEYRELGDEEKLKYLEAIARRAGKNRKSETDFAIECADNVKLAGGALSKYVFPKNKDGSIKLSVIAVIASATVVSEILLCVFLPSRYVAAFVLSPILLVCALCKIAVAVCPTRFVPATIADVFSPHIPNRLSKHVGVCFEKYSAFRDSVRKSIKLSNRRDRAKIFSDVVCETIPPLASLSSVVLLFVCAVDFDLSILFIAMLPYIATAACALHESAANMSARPVIGVLYSVYELINAPVYVLDSIAAAICVASHKGSTVPNTRSVSFVSRTVASATSVALVVLAGVFGGYAICAIGGIMLVASVVDIPIVSISSDGKVVSVGEAFDPCAVSSAPAVMFCGNETALRTNVMGGDGLFMTADNRGRLSVVCGSGGVDAGDFDISVATELGEHKLSHCDGAHMTGRTVYFMSDGNTEIRAEAIAPDEPRCAAVCLSIINRTAETENVKVLARCLPKYTGAFVPTLRVFECGIGGIADDGASLCASDRILHSETVARIPPFGKKEVAVCLFFARDERTVSRGVSQVSSEGFFARETFAASGRTVASYLPVAAETAQDNAFVEAGYENILCDGRLCAILGKRGYEYAVNGGAVTRRRRGLETGAPTLVMLGIGDEVYDLSDCENVFHGLGFSEYTDKKDACSYSLKRYIARGHAAEIFDLQMTNESDDRKSADVMFAALSGMIGQVEVYRSGDRVCAVRKSDGKGFAVMSSLPISDHAFYREGYYAYGSVDRVSDFRKGGTEIAPAVSCRVEMPPFGTARAVFALACIGEESELESIDEERADEFLADEIELFTATSVCPETRDAVLDSLYLRALYVAFTGGFLLGEEQYDITCIAAKYLDADGVRRRISERLRASAPDGLIMYLIEDHMEYSGDDLYSETVNGTTVAELCLNAADKLARDAVLPECEIIDKLSALRVLKIHSNKCDTVRKRKYIKAMSALAADVEKYFYGNICTETTESVTESSLYVLGGVFPSRGREIVAELEPKVKRLCERLMQESDGREIENVFSAALIYCAAAYAVNDDGRAFDIVKLFTEMFSPCGKLGERLTPRIAAMFYSLVTTRLFGVNICGDRSTLEPHLCADCRHVEYLMPKSFGRAHISADCNGDGGAWNMRVGRITYATSVLGAGENDGDTVYLFRASADN